MKYIKLFEKFTKEYQSKIDLKDFKKIKKGSKIQYMGGPVEVVDNNGYVLKLKDDDGKTFTVNKSQFDHGGRISEVSDGKKKKKKKEFHPDMMYELKSLNEASKIKVTKDKWPYVEFKADGKLRKVDFDDYDEIDDHGNEGKDLSFLGKDQFGQEWSIEVYVDASYDYSGNIGEIRWDTIVKESKINEAKDNLYLQLHKKYAEQIKGLKAKKIKKLTDLVWVQRSSMEDREDYFDMDPKKKKELSAEYNEERKLFKKYMARDYSVMLPKGTESLRESSSKDGGDKSNGNSHHDDHQEKSIAQEWKDTYGEEFHSKYPAIAKIIKQRNIKDKRELSRIWQDTYGENFEEQYPALFNKLD